MADDTAVTDQLAKLAPYFAARQKAHAERVEEQWDALSPRERRLVREAAVMGYVQGFQDAPYRDGIPHDRDIVARVLSAADDMGDLYPTLFRAGRRKRLTRKGKP